MSNWDFWLALNLSTRESVQKDSESNGAEVWQDIPEEQKEVIKRNYAAQQDRVRAFFFRKERRPLREMIQFDEHFFQTGGSTTK